MVYIDREKAQKYLLTYQNDGHSYEPSYFASALENLPAADVIERCKVNKAIDEIKREINSDFWNNSFCDGMNLALEILKRNIGE